MPPGRCRPGPRRRLLAGGAAAGCRDCGRALGRYVVEIFTTEGSTCLAIWLNAFDSSTGLGITSGVAPGAAWLVLGGLHPVADQRADDDPDAQREQHQRERKQLLCAQLCRRNSWTSYSSVLRPGHHMPALHCYSDGCCRGFNGFNSTSSTPPKIRAAPAAARPDRPSPTRQIRSNPGKTGSSM